MQITGLLGHWVIGKHNYPDDPFLFLQVQRRGKLWREKNSIKDNEMISQEQRSKSIAISLSMIFLISLVVYLIVWKNAPYLTFDSLSYMRVAQDLQDGRLDHLHDRTLGYPLILLITQSTDHPSRSLFVFQLLLHFAAVSMVVSALYQHGFSKKANLKRLTPFTR